MYVIFADQVFVDPTFLGTFVCSPLWLIFIPYGETPPEMCYVFRLQVYARVRISLAEDYRKGRDFMKSLVHTEELCSRRVPLEQNPSSVSTSSLLAHLFMKI